MESLATSKKTERQILSVIAEASESEVKRVFKNAQIAFQELKKTDTRQRVQELHSLTHYILDKKESIVNRITLETGKCRTDALVSEILGVLDYIHWLTNKAPKILAPEKADTPLTLMGKTSYIQHEALGSVLIISPWNYPFHISTTAILAAFVAGNSVVFKPSEVTPLNGLLEELLAVSPMLRRSVQIIYGSGITAQLLIDEHPAKIFFTGSAKTGKRILKQAAEMLIPCELELGGKDQAIVFDDVNIERTVAGVLWGALTNTGQSCTSIERIYVQEGIYNEFVEKLAIEAEKLIINNGDQGDADIGAMTVEFQLDIVNRHVKDAIKKGARLVCGGEMLDSNLRFYLPTILTHLDDTMDIMKDETFGPLLPVIKFKVETQVVEESNSSEFGLSASVWSKDLTRAKRVASALEVGSVSINNVMLTEGNPNLPFGGTKASGFGRVKGAEGLLGFTQSKAIMVDKQSKKIEANWYPYTRKKYGFFTSLIEALFSKSPIKLIKVAIAGLKLESEAQKPR